MNTLPRRNKRGILFTDRNDQPYADDVEFASDDDDDDDSTYVPPLYAGEGYKVTDNVIYQDNKSTILLIAFTVCTLCER